MGLVLNQSLSSVKGIHGVKKGWSRQTIFHIYLALDLRLISVIRTIFNAKLKRYYKDETVGNKRSLANFFIYMGHVNLSLEL